MEKDFTITMERTGGFAGITSIVRVESIKLAENEKEMLQDLILNSGVLNSQELDHVHSPVRDAFQYSISIEDGNGIQKIQVNESILQVECQYLFSHLKSLSKK